MRASFTICTGRYDIRTYKRRKVPPFLSTHDLSPHENNFVSTRLILDPFCVCDQRYSCATVALVGVVSSSIIVHIPPTSVCSLLSYL